MLYSALIGNPVEHSCSPKLFEFLAKKANLDYSHIKILVEDQNNVEKSIEYLKELGFCGINVTCPYKVDVYNLLKNIDRECSKIKSVNTIKVVGDKLIGYNTDGIAAIAAIEKVTKINSKDKIVMFGAGGVARSVVYELSKFTKNIVIFNKELDQAQQMIKDLELQFNCYDLSDRSTIVSELKTATIVINATTVGMKPNENESIISENEIKQVSGSKKLFFDVVFNPWETQFINFAKQNGHITVGGGQMLIYQALYAFNVWTGIKVNLTNDDMLNLKEVLINEINKH